MYSYETTTENRQWFPKVSRALAAVGILCVLAGCAPESQNSEYLSSTSQSSLGGQLVFTIPEQAVDSLVTAARENRSDNLLKILGPNAHQIIYSGDKVADTEDHNRFVALYDQAHAIKSDDARYDTLVVGDEEWPLPIPLVHADNGWWFDAATGQEEILNRRICRNELNVLKVSQIYVEAQKNYSALHAYGEHQHEYAQHFQSSLGHHDGLYWPEADGQPQSPLGPFMASAVDEGYSGKVLSKLTPYHGYYYRILKRQGPYATDGAKGYIVHGHMRRGFALIAFPDRYGDSGEMTFIVNQDGVVYKKDLGFTTNEVARVMREFDPDDSWNIVIQ